VPGTNTEAKEVRNEEAGSEAIQGKYLAVYGIATLGGEFEVV
jgi:hypothetical protein